MHRRLLMLAVVASTALGLALYGCGEEFTEGDDDDGDGAAGAGATTSGPGGAAGSGAHPDGGKCTGCGAYIDECLTGLCPGVGTLCAQSAAILGTLVSCVCHAEVCAEPCGGFCGVGVDQATCLECLARATTGMDGACVSEWAACNADR